jgi:tRNA (guanosine-2'-O-)-methyltransferase
MHALEEAVRKGYGTPEDPGLRDRFTDLPRAPIRIICCTLDKGINHGNILRIADCFRIEQVDYSPVGRRKERDFSGGFAALRWQPYRWIAPTDAIREAKAGGHRIYALSLGKAARPLRTIAWKHPAAIVLGQEWYGIDEDVAELCDEFVAIPLYGMIESLNVAVSAALAVESCFSAFLEANPGFSPAREASLKLMRPQPEG